MALKATIFKAELSVADLDRHHYADYALTIARHPSETDERMMVRLLAFALFADERLRFGPGLSDEDEAALVEDDLTGRIAHWIEVGLPDEKRLARAAGRADRVSVLAYGSPTKLWWQGIESRLTRLDRLAVFAIAPEDSRGLAALAERSMRLSVTIQDAALMLATDRTTIQLALQRLK